MTGEQVFVMTGCAGGIGRHLTGVLAARGHRVLATDVRQDALAECARADGWDTERVILGGLDVRDAEQWSVVLKEAVERFGRLDVLINIAGYLRPGWIHEASSDEVHRHIDINTKGVIFGMQAAARYMMVQRRGHIINMASMAALVPVPGLGIYSASKFAVRAVSLSAARELRAHGVFVTVVCPDAVQTPMLDLQKDRPEAALTFSAPKLLTVEDIARVILQSVLRKKPLEVFIPSRRGWLARFADLVPTAALYLDPILRRRGRERQSLEAKRRS